MTKNSKKNKVSLAVKVHPSHSKKKKKISSVSTSTSFISSKKTKSILTSKRVKRKKTVKNSGFLKKEKENKFKKEKQKVKSDIKPDGLILDDEIFYDNSYREERAKILLMKSGVTFFMLLIFVMWVYNVKQGIFTYKTKNKNNASINILNEIQSFNIKLEKEKTRLKDDDQGSLDFKENTDKIMASDKEIKLLKEKIEEKLNNQ